MTTFLNTSFQYVWNTKKTRDKQNSGIYVIRGEYVTRMQAA